MGVSYQNIDDASETVFLVGPVIRYYPGSNHKFYVHGGASFGSCNTTGPDGMYTVSNYDGGAAFALFLANNFSMDAGFGYGYNVVDQDALKLTTSGFYVDLGFTYFFGNNNE